MPEHVGVRLEPELRLCARTLDHAREARGALAGNQFAAFPLGISYETQRNGNAYLLHGGEIQGP
jgi:hypothetical protein